MIFIKWIYQASNFIEKMAPRRLLFMLLGSIFGFTQMWRVPALAYEYGGIYFIIIYGVCLVSIGNAACLMEGALSQYTSKGCVEALSMVPISTGLGYSSLVLSFISFIFNVQLSCALFFYMLFALRTPVTWTVCTKERLRSLSYNCSLTPAECFDPAHCKYPSEYFWITFLGWEYPYYSPYYGGLGRPVFVSITSVFSSWTLVFFAAFQPDIVRAYISFIVPILIYPILLILSSIAITEPGGLNGLTMLFSYSYSYLYSPETWFQAVEQAFYSLGIGMGIIGHHFKQLPFSLKTNWSITFITLTLLLASTICTFFVFIMLGIFADRSSTDFFARTKGPALWFISFSEASVFGPVRNMVPFFLFLTLYVLAVATIGVIIENLEEHFYMIYPNAKRYSVRFVVSLLVVGFFLSYPVFLRGGFSLYYGMFDHFILMYGVFLIVTCEFLFLSYGYGLGRFCEDIAFMYGWYPNRFYRYIWGLGGFFTFSVLLYELILWKFPQFLRLWSFSVGSVFIFIIICPTIISALLKLRSFKGTRALAECFKPHPDFLPADDVTRSNRLAFKCSRRIF